MIDDKEFLSRELQMGVSLDNLDFCNLAMKTASKFEKLLHNYQDYIPPERERCLVLDYGAGVGAYSKAFMERGWIVVAYEKFDAHREYLNEKLPNLILTDGPVEADILLFIETAEHMTDQEIIDMLSIVKPVFIIFSSTPYRSETDEEWGHINIKSDDEWDMFFRSFKYYKEVSMRGFPTPWAKLYMLDSSDI